MISETIVSLQFHLTRQALKNQKRKVYFQKENKTKNKNIAFRPAIQEVCDERELNVFTT
jgi:hypothetical protein